MEISLVVAKFNQIRATENGVDRFNAHRESLQVCPRPDGGAIISVVVSGQESLLFSLDAAQRDHFVALLQGKPFIKVRHD